MDYWIASGFSLRIIKSKAHWALAQTKMFIKVAKADYIFPSYPGLKSGAIETGAIERNRIMERRIS